MKYPQVDSKLLELLDAAGFRGSDEDVMKSLFELGGLYSRRLGLQLMVEVRSDDAERAVEMRVLSNADEHDSTVGAELRSPPGVKWCNWATVENFDQVITDQLLRMVDGDTLLPREDWKEEVASGNTRLGYEEWSMHQAESLLADVRRATRKLSTRKFYRQVITTTVLSEDMNSYSDLQDVYDDIMTGECSGQTTYGGWEEVDGPTMAKLLQEQGSDPSFFRLNEDGTEMQ